MKNLELYVPTRMQGSRREFSCAILGAGPAGMGFLFHAFKSGKLADIARKGLLIIDKRSWLGSGKLGDYANVVGNSVGKTFLACLEHETLETLFDDIRNFSPLHRCMVAAGDGAPQLRDAGDLLALAAERLIAHLVAHYDVTVLRGYEVDTLQRRAEGGYDIVYRDLNDPKGLPLSVSSETVVMNFGGMQRTAEIDSLCDGLGLPAPGPDAERFTSDELLSCNTAQLVGTFAPVFARLAEAGQSERRKRVTVIGGAHSAFSVVDRLATELGCVGIDEIAVVHRSAIRLFFETAELAREHGYAIDEANDICPVTKRVNRSSGLRYRAFDVARSIMATGKVPGMKPPVELIEVGSGEAARQRAAECLADSIAVVHGAGYGPNLPSLNDRRGAPIPLQFGQGGLVSDPTGRPFDVYGDVVPGLFSFGLGSGFRPDAQIGSEAAFRGRIYGVWIFHHDIGGKVLKGVLEALEGGTAGESSSDSDAPAANDAVAAGPAPMSQMTA